MISARYQQSQRLRLRLVGTHDHPGALARGVHFKRRAITRTILAILLWLGVSARGAEAPVNISGVFVESGMLMRGSSGAPRDHVSLCALLTGLLDSRTHAALANTDRFIHVEQKEDLVLDIVIAGGPPGKCTGSWTKAEGLKVGPAGVSFSKHSKTSTLNYHFALGTEGALIVEIDFEMSQGGRKLRENAQYAFPRASKSQPSVDDK